MNITDRDLLNEESVKAVPLTVGNAEVVLRISVCLTIPKAWKYLPINVFHGTKP